MDRPPPEREPVPLDYVAPDGRAPVDAWLIVRVVLLGLLALAAVSVSFSMLFPS
jgi:hypothetical protein